MPNIQEMTSKETECKNKQTVKRVHSIGFLLVLSKKENKRNSCYLLLVLVFSIKYKKCLILLKCEGKRRNETARSVYGVRLHYYLYLNACIINHMNRISII